MPAIPPTALKKMLDIENIPAPQSDGSIEPALEPMIMPIHMALRGDMLMTY